jgi:hypothetical protein
LSKCGFPRFDRRGYWQIKWFVENGWTSWFCGRNLKCVKNNDRKFRNVKLNLPNFINRKFQLFSKRWMRIFQIACGLTIFVLTLNSCSTVETGAGLPTPSFDGDWRGTMKSVAGAVNKYQYEFRIVINGNSALAYELVTNKWAEIADNTFGTVKYKISKMGDLYVVTWVNQGVMYDWSEEQTYSLSYVNPSRLKIVQLRHVNNREKDKDGVPWFYVCTGTLTNAN